MYVLGRYCLASLTYLLFLSALPAQVPDAREALFVRAGETDSLALSARYYTAVTRRQDGTELLDSLTGAAYHKLGVVAYLQDTLPRAAHYFREAVRVRETVYPEAHNDVAHSLGNLGLMYQLMKELDSAAVAVGRANAIYETLPTVDSLNWLRSLNTLGLLAFTLERYQLGRSASYRAVRLVGEMEDPDPYEAFVTYYRAARIQLRLDAAEEALPLAQRAVALAPAVPEEQLLPGAYNLLGLVQRALEDYEASYASFTAARRLLEAQNEDSPDLAFVYANVADYHGRVGEREAFYTYDRRAKEQFVRAQLLDEYYALDHVPQYLGAWGQRQEALDWLDEAIAYLTESKDVRDTVVHTEELNADIVPLIKLLERRAETYTALAREDQALRDYRKLFTLQRSLRAEAGDNASRQYYSQHLRPTFDRAIELYYRAYRETGDSTLLWEAFLLSEQSRASTLLANLQAGRPEGRIQELTERVAELERRVAPGPSALRDTLELTRLQLQRLQGGDQAPAVAVAITRDALREHLRRSGTTLLEYHLSGTLNLLFVFTPTGELSAVPLTLSHELTQHITDWRTAITESSYRRKSLRTDAVQAQLDARFVELGRQLAEQLLPSSVSELSLSGPLPRKPAVWPRLCIIPDGPLHYLPFAALPLGEAALPLRYGELPYLATRYELQHAYSATHLLELDRRASTAHQRVLTAFAPSFAGTSDGPLAQRSAGEVLRSGRGLSGLRYNQEEVAQIAELFADAAVYRGAEASKERFVEVVGDSRILHLSSHGMVDSERPELSFIAFAQTADSLQRDQLLYFNDLYTLPLDNELTVLSACETSLGKLAPGETTMSLASAFAAAGARSTLTTLWQVDDEATKLLTVAFYRALADGVDRATALHAAQHQLLTSGDYAHPYYWSGMALHGQAGPLPVASDDELVLDWWGWLIVGVALLLSLGYFLRFLYQGRPEVQLRR